MKRFLEPLQFPPLRRFKTPFRKRAVSRRRPATLGPTSNTLPTTPATYFVLETGPLGTGQWHGGYGDRHGGFARVSVEATSSSKDKTTYLLITHLTRLDKLPKARTMHEVIRSIWAKRDAPQGTRCRRSVQGSPQVGHRARSPLMQSWLRFSHTSLRMIRLRPYASTDQCVHRRPCSEVLCDGLNAIDILAGCPYTALNDLRRIGRTYPHAPR